MEIILGWIMIIFPGILVVGQAISSINFSLAQRLGLQENPEHTDLLVQTAERYAAYWDLITLTWMPLSGLLIVVDNSYWPIVSLIAGAIYFDTSGREAAKMLSFKHQGVRIGPPTQHKFFFSTYFMMATLGIIVIITSLAELT